jgi:predicted dehydrogenase
VAVADPSDDRRRLVAGSAGVPSYGTVAEMILTTGLEALVVATPPETHRGVVETALAAGLPVLVEKPLAPSVPEARRLVQAAEHSSLPVLVGFNRRRLVAARRLRTVLEHVRQAEIEMESEFHALPSVWDPVAGARDPLDDLASHHLDLFRFLTGSDIVTIEADRRARGEVELRLRLESGARASCVVSQGLVSRERVSVRVRRSSKPGTTGAWMLRPSSDRITPAGGPARSVLDRAASILRRARRGADPMARSFEAQLRALVDCARGEGFAVPGVRDGLAVAEAVERARESLER